MYSNRRNQPKTSKSIKMKPISYSFLRLGVVFCLLFPCDVLGSGSCTISPCVNGGPNSTIVFTFTPTPTDLINSLGLGSDKSPVGILNLLQSYTNTALGAVTSLQNLVYQFLPFLRPVPVISCRYYWITNQLFCDNVPFALIAPFCSLFNTISNVTSPITNFTLPSNPLVPLTCENDTVRPWGLTEVQAPQAWNLGWKGQGVVVANIDSGVRATHVELASNLRSTYNWFDPYGISTTPTDSTGHGTHTMGTMVGQNVGVAPSAQWIACRGCSSSSCGNEQLLKCGQWLACPDNKTLNCTTRPNVINNSWGGGVGDTTFAGMLSTWKALGIVSFFSSGNSGNNNVGSGPTVACSTLVSPADSNYTQYGFLSVGSTDCDDVISSFSSTGPSQAGGYFGGLGVQIVGPGTNVKSSWSSNDTAYEILSGTSMSSPHIAGAAAVLLSKNPSLTPAQVYGVLMNNTDTRSDVINSALYCGNSNYAASSLAPGYPNNVYGFGRVNVFKCVQ